MAREFDMSNLGVLSSYLGIEVKQGKDFIFLSQMAYTQKILQHAKLGDCNAAITLEARAQFTYDEGKSMVNSVYRSLIGSLRYFYLRWEYSVGIWNNLPKSITSG